MFAIFAGLTVPFTGLILRRDFGATPFQLAVASSAGAISLLLSVLWASPIRGRSPLPYVVWPGLASRGLFALIPLVQSAWGMVGVLASATFVGTTSGPAQAALIERVYPRDQRGRALGLVKMAGIVVAVVLAVWAGALLSVVAFRWVCVAAAVVGVGGSLILRRMRVPDAAIGMDPRRSSEWHAHWSRVLDDRSFRSLLVASFVFGLGCWIQVPANPIVLADIVHVTTPQVGWLAAIGGAAGLFGTAWWGRLVDRRSSLSALRLVWMFGAITPLVYVIARSPWMLVGSAVTDGLMSTGLDIVWTVAVIDAAGPRRAAHYAAVSATATGVRGVLGPLLGALVIEHAGVHAVYLIATAMMLVAVWLLTRQVRAIGVAPVPRYRSALSSPSVSA